MNPDNAVNNRVRLVECPRDAMQGWPDFIPTEKKIDYLNALLGVGFDTLDFGSFVSARAIPQMADTRDLMESLRTENSSTRLLAIVANARGAEEAASYSSIHDLGFPFSVSETFQKRNTNAGITAAYQTVASMLDIAEKKKKRLVIYISMAFGNPYGDDWSADNVMEHIRRLVDMGVGVVSLADTVGLADPAQVRDLTRRLILDFPGIETGVHLHSRRESSLEKLGAALEAGCRRFDGALKGIGGCPMAGDELVGNMDSLLMIDYFRKKNMLPAYDDNCLAESIRIANEIFIPH